ncbi:S1 family peptidase [Portibacter lacus]|uniref:Serine protease n=1 Tax=Portibacter lacus TaxID=1099794 RepID=A0AA37SR49_9BACT|nr:serine protease [Portibacter lacus]GLR16160.1 hypothetical protein GCM10007940_07750 [Portibacter lacus]
MHAKPHNITVPIFGLKNQKPKFIGTGFFIDHIGGIVTAKHVLDRADIDPKSEFLFTQIVNDSSFQPRKIRHIFHHESADICLAKPNVLQIDGKDFENPIWEYDFDKPSIGEKVMTFAYPKTNLKDPVANIWSIVPENYHGELLEIHSRCPTCGITTECYQTTIDMLSGSSGGPVFNEAGKVIGVNSMSYDVEEGEIPISFVTPLNFLLDIKIQNEGEEILFRELIGYKLGSQIDNK